MNGKNFEESYFLGLDIGTDSVGYAATDQSYSLLKFHGEPMWGTSLFDEALLNTDRRGFRTGRRRIDRRQQRVKLLSELFATEIGKIDEKFFIRLQNSALYPEDKDEPGSLFGQNGYTDADYHRQYPTIHHLICELMSSTSPHDVRLVYLACAWLVAHRGHFLNEIDADDIDELINFDRVWDGFAEAFGEQDVALPWTDDEAARDELQAVLKKKQPITKKYNGVCNALFRGKKPPKEIPGLTWDLTLVLKLLCGSTVSAEKLFGNEEYSEIGSFSLSLDEDKLAGVLAQLGSDALIVERAKAVFDWALLADSLEGHNSISEAKVAIYDRHKKDLAFLKGFVRKYLPEKYREIFQEVKDGNYTSYSYHYKKDKLKEKLKKTGKEQFSKYILSLVGKVEPQPEDHAAWEDMKARLELQSFLPKQRDTDNRVIPHQIYEKELNDLLKSAEAYLPFLSQKDEKGLTVSDKIRAVFAFRIPYFVGPLNRHSQRAWFELLPGADGHIRPWNFDDQVDQDASEREFIRRMTNTCTYLPGENVLPKQSLLYTSFNVLNEINNLKIDGEKIPVELKQRIYNELFLRHNKVTPKKLENYLLSINALQEGQNLSGIDQAIKSNLKPWHDFKRLLESGALTTGDVEKIIERSTYSEDKSRFVKWLNREYPELSSQDRQYISKLSYKDFGRLSRKFLVQLPGTDLQTGTGEAVSIMATLWNTNFNLMELLSERFTFKKAVDDESRAYYATHPKKLEERMDEMYLSNAVKRPVLRTLAIVHEVTKAVGHPPAKIFVEMTRGGTKEQKGKRIPSRKEQILALYERCDEEDVRILREELENMGDDADSRLQSDALFLYYIQLGKCVYTGEAIVLENLKKGDYNIEHIWPQALLKDDSILNNRVLVTSEVNGQKQDKYPIDGAIRQKMHSFWTMLKKNGLITDEKYRRLTRSTPFSDDEKFGFVQRQLTQTSQSTKAVATLLKEKYPDTEIVYVKAMLTSEFRQEFDLLKSRTFNDLHHAKDAYLNIVTGNVYDMKFSRQWFRVDESYSVKTRTIFSHPVICGGKTVWDGENMLAKVKNTVSKNNAHIVKYAYCRAGGLFDQQPVKKAEGLVPRKAGLPTEKYGGYNKPSICFFALVKYFIGQKSDVMVMSVELLHKDEFLAGGEPAEQYAKRHIGKILNKQVDKVLFPLGGRIIKVNTILSLDGFRASVSGVMNGGGYLIISPFVQFSADHKTETYLKRLESMTEKAQNPNFVYHAEYDKVTKEENLALYDLYIKKLGQSIYQKRPNNPLKALQNGREKFVSLSPVDQARALLNIHQIFGRISGGCDLTLVGGTARAASVYISSSISNWKKNYHDVRIIDCSSSGLWEKQSDNLLELL